MNPQGRRDLQPLRPRRVLETSRPRRGNRYALTIGINDYDVASWKLDNALNDATVVATRLEDVFDYGVTRLFDKQATLEGIRSILAEWRAAARPEDDLLIFFAGHGQNHQSAGAAPEGYLVPVNADQDPTSWLSEAEIIQCAREMQSQRIFLVFDACYTGTAMRLSDAIQAGARDDQVLKILVAGTEDQPVLDGGARDHSVFTRAFLDGLDGLADAGQQPDGIVSAEELIVYVRSEVPWRSRMRGAEQMPVGGALQGTRGGDDFEFRPGKPRLSAAVLRNLYSREPADRKAAAEALQDHRKMVTAGIAAGELIHLLRDDRPPYGRDTMSEEDQVAVRSAAAEALGLLGHPQGFEPLTSLLDSQDPAEDPAGLRATAAASLGVLAESGLDVPGYDLPGLRQDAIERLVEALQDADGEVRQAAMGGLGRLPDSVPQLVAELQLARNPPQGLGEGARRRQWQPIVEALASVADRHPEDEGTWPALPGIDARLLRRIHLVHLRLGPHQVDMTRQAVFLGLLGAFGLSMAFLVVVAAVFRASLRVFGPATLTVTAPAGFLAGAAFALLPRLSCGAAWRSSARAPLLGGLGAGLLLSLWIFIPNWFMGIGCVGNHCEWYNWLLWLVPGLVVGPLLGLALICPSWRLLAATPAKRSGLTDLANMLRSNMLAFALVMLAGGLGTAVVRSPVALTFASLEPRELEVLLWGVGGAILGAMLAAGWYVTLPTGSRLTVTRRNLCQVLLGRQVPAEAKGVEEA